MTAEYFDGWFADIAGSEARRALFNEHLGTPAEVDPSDLVPLEGLREIAAALRLPDNGELVDLACGRGGPGMWIARELGAELVGVDFSAEAIRQASERRKLFGLTDRATFAVGTLDDTGLAAGSADGLICIDAFQFSDDGVATASEIRRVLRPGGRLVVTSWEPVDRDDERLSDRIRRVDLVGAFEAAGLSDIQLTEKAAWRTAERTLWETARDLDPAGDPAIESAVAEAHRVLETFDVQRRVMLTATAP